MFKHCLQLGLSPSQRTLRSRHAWQARPTRRRVAGGGRGPARGMAIMSMLPSIKGFGGFGSRFMEIKGSGKGTVGVREGWFDRRRGN